MINKAILFARYAHRNQLRKWSNEAYWTHTERVGNKAFHLGLDIDVVAAAYLHDVIEDQEVTVELLTSLFNSTVANYVWQLSDQSTLADGNRKTRKAIDRYHITQASSQIKTVKLIDTEDNLLDIQVTNADFAKVYFKEKRDLLEVLRDGDQRMVAQVQKVLDDYFG